MKIITVNTTCDCCGKDILFESDYTGKYRVSLPPLFSTHWVDLCPECLNDLFIEIRKSIENVTASRRGLTLQEIKDTIDNID